MNIICKTASHRAKVSLLTLAICAFAATMVVPAARADSERGKYKAPHDSNSLHKLGNAIQYPFRKMGENTSITTHRAIGHKSVQPNQIRKENVAVTPGGHTIVKNYYGSRYYAHHMRHHRYHRRSHK